MALTFTDNGAERVDCGSASSLDDLSPFTFFAWIYIDGTGFRFGRIVNKGEDVKEFAMDGTASQNASKLYLGVNTDATDAVAAADTDQTTGEWRFVAGTYDTTDGPRLFSGNLSTAVSEESYTTRTVGTGSPVGDGSSDFWIGNRSSGTTNRAFGGRIAVVGAIEALLTVGQLKAIQYRPAACLLHSQTVGFWVLHGTGTQPDYSGNGNSGTVTGATAGAHVPLGSPFAFDTMEVLTTAAAASTIPVFMHHYRVNIG